MPPAVTTMCSVFEVIRPAEIRPLRSPTPMRRRPQIMEAGEVRSAGQAPQRPAGPLAGVRGTLGGGLDGTCFLAPAPVHETAPPTVCPGRSERTGSSPG